MEKVNNSLKEKMLSAYNKVRALSEKEGISLKKSAYKIAIERIVEKFKSK